MAWKTGLNAPLGLPNAIQPITPDIAALVPVGTVAAFVEDTQGPGNLIYLPGVAGLLAGDAIIYDLLPGGAAVFRLANTVANSGRPVAIALSAVGVGQYGWFQLSGVAVVNAIAGVAVGVVFVSATAGSLGSAVIAGSQILNARFSSGIGAPAAGKAYMTLYNPFIQGQIT
jgi:hypothetical protein